jgi:hypothetical protein
MKAVRYHSHGDSDVLAYEEAHRPAGAGQVVVRVAAAPSTRWTPRSAPACCSRCSRWRSHTFRVAQRRPLADLAAVHDEAAAGRLAGKTVLTPA